MERGEGRSELVNCSRESLKSFAQIVAQICNFRIKFDSNYLSVEDPDGGSGAAERGEWQVTEAEARPITKAVGK